MTGLDAFMDWDDSLVNPTLKLNLSTSGITSKTSFFMTFLVNELSISEPFELVIMDCTSVEGSGFAVDSAGAGLDSEGTQADEFHWNVS